MPLQRPRAGVRARSRSRNPRRTQVLSRRRRGRAEARARAVRAKARVLMRELGFERGADAGMQTKRAKWQKTSKGEAGLKNDFDKVFEELGIMGLDVSAGQRRAHASGDEIEARCSRHVSVRSSDAAIDMGGLA